MIVFGAAQTQEQQLTVKALLPPRLTIDVSTKHVTLSGDVSSVAHESILRQRALALFPNKTKSFAFRERPALPPGWALISELSLRAVVDTYSSRTEITTEKIHVRGITNDASVLREELSRIEKFLPSDMRLQLDLTEIDMTDSLDRQCASIFRTAMHGRRIEFPRAGTNLGTSASPLLDELIQIAADCPAGNIVITGHTDDTGNESGNLVLSTARAGAVAAYMTAGGIATGRITVKGVGSSQPLDAEQSSRARQLNRRIEIEMVFLPR